MSPLKKLALGLFLSTVVITVDALDIDVVEYEGEHVIYLADGYVEGDAKDFEETLKDYPSIKTVVLGDSPGGLTSESYPISRMIRDNNIKTIVFPNSKCISSCAIVWLGGIDRTMSEGSELWFHRPYVDSKLFLDSLDIEGYCEDDDSLEEGEICRPWSREELLQIQDFRTSKIIAEFYVFLVEMGVDETLIPKMLDTDPWTYYKIKKQENHAFTE